MLQNTKGIVLRSIKYGETSLICSIFTEVYGVQSYLIQGVRSSKARNKASLLQPTTLLDMVVYHKPNANLQRAKEFQPAYIYQALQEHIVKNSVALFSVELLLRLLPEQAPMPELFELSFEYLTALDKAAVATTGNYPIFLMVQCCNMMGYAIHGSYTADTPYLNLAEGSFSALPQQHPPHITDEETSILSKILNANSIDKMSTIAMNGDTRFRIIDWLLAYMHSHTQHMGTIKSLPILRTILH